MTRAPVSWFLNRLVWVLFISMALYGKTAPGEKNARGPQEGKTRKCVRVKNADQFIDAIAPDTTVVLEDGVYHLDTSKKNRPFARCSNDTSRFRLEITGVKGLTIKAEKKASILSGKKSTGILSFLKCDDLNLENLDIGYTGSFSSSEAGGHIIRIGQSNRVSIKNCTLHGTGFAGLKSERVTGLTVLGSTITGCRYNLVEFNDSRDILFDAAELTGTRGEKVIRAKNSSHILFQNCKIHDNWSGSTDEWEDPGILFYLEECRDISLRDSTVAYNCIAAFTNNATQIRSVNNKIHGNDFRTGNGAAPSLSGELIRAVTNGDVETAKSLVPGLNEIEEGNMLKTAVELQLPLLVELLLEKGAYAGRRVRYEMGDGPESGVGPLLNLAAVANVSTTEKSKKKSLDILRLLIAYGAGVNQNDCLDMTPLMLVCRKGAKGAAGLLIEKGADVNETNGETTPLHEAAIYGQPKIVALLIGKGADVNRSVPGYCNTPLHHAVSVPCMADGGIYRKKEKQEVVSLLLEHGANPNRRNCMPHTKQGLTAHELAKRIGYKEIAGLLASKK